MGEHRGQEHARGFGPRLREMRERRGLTLQELAHAAGCTKGYLSSVENEKRGAPTDEMLARLERALGLGEGELVRAAGWERTPATVRREVVKLAAREAAHRERERKLTSIFSKSGIDASGRLLGGLDEAYKSGELASILGIDLRAGPARASDTAAAAPLVGALNRVLPLEVPLINKVVAGYPREFTDLGYPARVADEYVRCPDIDDPDAFAARVVGDSMLPDYREGDIVVFSPVRAIKSGMDCFARLEPDGETTFKRVFFEHTGEGVPAAGDDAETKADAPAREFMESRLKGQMKGQLKEQLVAQSETTPQDPEHAQLRAESQVQSEVETRRQAPMRFEGDASGVRVRLQPLNPAYAARVVEREQVGGLYAAVSVIKRL